PPGRRRPLLRPAGVGVGPRALVLALTCPALARVPCYTETVTELLLPLRKRRGTRDPCFHSRGSRVPVPRRHSAFTSVGDGVAMPYLLALLAAVLFAVSTVLQQGAARSSARRRGPRTRADWLPVLGLLGRLLRDPGWLAGWLLNVAGFVAHALALHRGSIAPVQAILVVQLTVALML